jgi:short-subunit dehydrogenase
MVFARRLAAKHDLLLIARRKDRLETLAAELIAQYGGAVSVLAADLTNANDLATVAERIARETNLALLINDAGFGARGLFWKTSLETQEQMHSLHISATLRLCHAALKNMVARDSGAIINVASVAAFVRRTGSVSYGATKCWMATFTEGLYLELKSVRSSVKVQALCPGFTYSEFHDTMKIDRNTLAPPSLWLRAEFVVDESLKALGSGRLFVVPGWRYKALVSLITKLPVALRLAFETAGSKLRTGSRK